MASRLTATVTLNRLLGEHELEVKVDCTYLRYWDSNGMEGSPYLQRFDIIELEHCYYEGTKQELTLEECEIECLEETLYHV